MAFLRRTKVVAFVIATLWYLTWETFFLVLKPYKRGEESGNKPISPFFSPLIIFLPSKRKKSFVTKVFSPAKKSRKKPQTICLTLFRRALFSFRIPFLQKNWIWWKRRQEIPLFWHMSLNFYSRSTNSHGVSVRQTNFSNGCLRRPFFTSHLKRFPIFL